MKIVLKINQLLDKHNEIETPIFEDHGKCEICEELERLGTYLDIGLTHMKDIEQYENDKESYLKIKQQKEENNGLYLTHVTKEAYLALPRYMSEEEKAKELGISLPALRKRRKNGVYSYKRRIPVAIKPLKPKRSDEGNKRKLIVSKEDYLNLPSDLTEEEKATCLGISDLTLRRRRKEWGLLQRQKVTREKYEALPKHLTLTKKAEILGCHRATLYNMIKNDWGGK